MGLDSAVLILEWEKYFKIEIPYQEAARIETIQDAVGYISSQMKYPEFPVDVKARISQLPSEAILPFNPNFSVTLDQKIFEVL